MYKISQSHSVTGYQECNEAEIKNNQHITYNNINIACGTRLALITHLGQYGLDAFVTSIHF